MEQIKLDKNKIMMKTSDKLYFDCKVVSRSIITDFVQGIRNFLGMELKGYTNLIDLTVKELFDKVDCDLKWYRIDIEQMSAGGFLVSIYGEKK